jgi:hypothetical protein
MKEQTMNQNAMSIHDVVGQYVSMAEGTSIRRCQGDCCDGTCSTLALERETRLENLTANVSLEAEARPIHFSDHVFVF